MPACATRDRAPVIFSVASPGFRNVSAHFVAQTMAKSFLFSASSVLAIDALLPKLWLQNAFHSATKPEEVLAKMGAHCAKSATVDTTPDSSASNQGSAVASNAALESVPRPRPIVCEYNRQTACSVVKQQSHDPRTHIVWAQCVAPVAWASPLW